MNLVDFQWHRCVAGYRLEPTKRGDDFQLTCASDWFETTHPLKIDTLFAIFAKTQATPKGMKAFCDNYGLLGGGRADIRQSRDSRVQSALVSPFLHKHARFRRAFDLFEKGDNSALVKRWNATDNVALIHSELRVGPEGRLQMVFVPPDLLHALWLQFALHACSEAKLFRCERCNKAFVVGSGTGRRSTSIWCSNACKVAAFKEGKAHQ
jgi:hypothetical protein